ncbi:MAG TPA: CDP-glucose 4,6-dehydratase [Bacteroidia bacterium]|nr:CDP-glucose 4,6-dehydratase [Bacteroidia bacterium]
MSFNKIYQTKKVFLTGHTGFKGSWMSVWLDMLGAKVKGYALEPERISLYNQIQTSLKHHESVIADIRDKKKLGKEILSFQPDFIFHFAAQPLVRESYKIPVETFEVNAIGTANLLETVRQLKKKCIVVIVTTDKVYENTETDYAYKESDKLGGYDPYSASKAAAEIIAESFRLSFFHPGNFTQHKKSIATARAGNVIGGGDYANDRIVPDIYRSLSKSELINIRNPKSVRPWQHVLEPLNGYLALAERMYAEPGKYADSFNFGPELKDTLTVEELTKLIIKSWGKGKYKSVNLKNSPHEAGLLKLNIEKAKNELDWNPKWNAGKAVEKTMDWYKESLKKKSDKFYLCARDIEEYKEV